MCRIKLTMLLFRYHTGPDFLSHLVLLILIFLLIDGLVYEL